MATDTFVDTSGFYAYLVRNDTRHATASALVKEAEQGRRRLVTSDYILDETATLLSARGHRPQAGLFLETVTTSRAVTLIWSNSARFSAALRFFRKHDDKGWSFTDCHSLALMQELDIIEALTSDHHFNRAGRVALLLSP